MLVRINFKKNFYLTLIVAFIGLLIAAGAITPFLLAKIEKANAELAERKKSSDILANKQGSFSAWHKEYRQIKPEADRINSSFLAPDNLLECIVAIEEIAKKTSGKYELKIIEEAKSDEKKKDAKQEAEGISFQVSFWGSFSGLVRFLSQLENMKYFNEVLALQIQRLDQKIGEQPSGIEIAAVLNIKVFTKENGLQ